MAVTVHQTYDEEASGGDSSALELHYIVMGTTDRDVAIAAVRAFAPATAAIDGRLVTIKNIDVDVVKNNDIWKATASYDSSTDSGEAGDEAKTSFDIGGASVHINVASGNSPGSDQSTVGYDSDGNAAPDPKNMIGLQPDGTTSGTDVIDGTYTYTLTQYFEDADITGSYKEDLVRLVGRLNTAVFDNHAAQVVRFDGVSGSQTEEDKWALVFRFSVRPNQSNVKMKMADGKTLTIPLIRGWQYLWVYYTTIDMPWNNLNLRVQAPMLAYVQDIYKLDDFGDLNLVGV